LHCIYSVEGKKKKEGIHWSFGYGLRRKRGDDLEGERERRGGPPHPHEKSEPGHRLHQEDKEERSKGEGFFADIMQKRRKGLDRNMKGLGGANQPVIA